MQEMGPTALAPSARPGPWTRRTVRRRGRCAQRPQRGEGAPRPPPRPLGRPGLQDKGQLQATRSPDTQVWTQAQRPVESSLPWAAPRLGEEARSWQSPSWRTLHRGDPEVVPRGGTLQGESYRGHGAMRTRGDSRPPGSFRPATPHSSSCGPGQGASRRERPLENLGTCSLRLLHCVERSWWGRRADRGASGSGASRRSPGGAEGRPAAGEGCTQTARGCFYLRPSTGRHPGAGRTGDAKGHRGSRRLEPQAPASRLTAHTGQ